MPTLRMTRSIVVSLALLLGSASAYAQARPQAPAAPAKPYEPQVGQGGKDVVWVPTPQSLVDKMLEMAKVTPADYVIDLGIGRRPDGHHGGQARLAGARHRIQPRHGGAVEAQRRGGGRVRARPRS